MGHLHEMTDPLLGVVIATLILGGLFIGMRVYTRTALLRGAFGWDDALIVVTWCIVVAYNACLFVAIHYGYGKHGSQLTLEEYEQVVHFGLLSVFFGAVSYPTGKASVAVCLMRIFPGKRLRWILWTIVAMNAIVCYLYAILAVVQCQPVSKQWNFGGSGSCWDISVLAKIGIFTGAVGCASDFALATIPWFYVPKLNMKPRERIAVGVALSMGYLAGACSIFKVYYTTRFTAKADYAYDTIPLVLSSCIELCMINVAACIPTLRPLGVKIGQYWSSAHSKWTSSTSRDADQISIPTPIDVERYNAPPRAEKGQILVESSFEVEHEIESSDDGIDRRQIERRF